MAALTTKARNALRASQFALPGRRYPIPDKAYAIDAKARATQALAAGRLSKSEAATVMAAANKVIKRG